MRTGPVPFRRAARRDYAGMLLLQRDNFIGNLKQGDTRDGFLSIEYTAAQFDEINQDLGISVAILGDRVVGYLCATTFRYGSRFPILVELIRNLHGRMMGRNPIDEETTFIYDPVCIAREVRGSGILAGLFGMIRELAAARCKQCILFVSDKNLRSFHAHFRKLVMKDLGMFAFNGKQFHMLGAAIGRGAGVRMNRQKELERIADEIRSCRLCKKGGSGLPVPGEGSGKLPVMFVGEAPGKQEAKTGTPFVGRSGKLLRQMIRDAGLDEQHIFITSPVHYLPDRGKPSPSMIEHGAIHLRKQIEILQPRVIVLLGSTACRALLGRSVEIAKEHGTVIEQDGIGFLISCHPAYAMRFPTGRRAFTQDFEKLQNLLKKTGMR